MEFFRRIKNSLCRFMYGRNGSDQLTLGILVLMLVVDMIRPFVRSETLSGVMATAGMLISLYMIFRIFSRNLAKRRAENAWFLQHFWWPVSQRLRSAAARTRDRDHKYFTCPNCRTVCRVPKGKGNIVITCPKCRSEIRGRT